MDDLHHYKMSRHKSAHFISKDKFFEQTNKSLPQNRKQIIDHSINQIS